MHVRKYKNGAAEMIDLIRLYELNTWMWRYGRGQPRLVAVAEAELQRKAAISDACTRAAETLKRHGDERGVDYCSRRSALDRLMDLLGLKTLGAI